MIAAEGRRVRKSTSSAIDEYVYDAAGRQIADLHPGGAVTRAELYVGQRHLATYDAASNSTYFIHGDWQGTERMRTSVSGASYETCSNLPFGDAQVCAGGADVSPMHYTGKPRDTETNLDYFGARYYNSTMARWMSPDWDAKPVTVPYAHFGDPQSLNLYGYVTDNPTSKQDGDGHEDAAPVPGGDAYNSMAGQALWASQTGGDEFTAMANWQAQRDPGQMAGAPAQQANSQAFDAIWINYPSHEAYGTGKPGTSGQSIQQLTGVEVVDTCALRMSYALNHSGFSISRKDGKSAMLGSDGKYYLVGQADVGRFITKHFGSPQNIGKSGVAGFDQSAQGSGFVRFSIRFAAGTATGHIALFRNGTFHEAEDDYTNPFPGHYEVQAIQYWRMQ